MIVIDTFGKGTAAGGGEENSARDQNLTAANLRRVQEETGVHVAVIGHTGKDETRGARGSNAHVGDVDMMVQIKGSETKMKTVSIIKNNDGPEGVLTTFKLEIAILGKDEDGDDITTAILSAVDTVDSKKEASRAQLNNSQRTAMDLLRRVIIDDGESAPVGSDWPKNIGKVVTIEAWRACCIKGGLSAGNKESAETAFRRAVRDLRALHRIGVWDGRGQSQTNVRSCPQSNSGQTRTTP
jgi:hypothetical protein